MTNLAALGASVAAYNTVFSNLSNYVWECITASAVQRENCSNHASKMGSRLSIAARLHSPVDICLRINLTSAFKLKRQACPCAHRLLHQWFYTYSQVYTDRLTLMISSCWMAQSEANHIKSASPSKHSYWSLMTQALCISLFTLTALDSCIAKEHDKHRPFKIYCIVAFVAQSTFTLRTAWAGGVRTRNITVNVLTGIFPDPRTTCACSLQSD